MLDFLKELVTIESPSTEKAAVDRLGERLIRSLADLGGRVEVFESEKAGSQILTRWGGVGPPVMVLCHMDTVFDIGTTTMRPFRMDAERAYGPGVLDMKASIAMLLSILGVFRREGAWPGRPLVTLFTSDEEIGSQNSRALIEETASQAEVVFCLEPGLPNGSLKTARKGTGEIILRANGVAAHAGADHERGRNAIEELAHHILAAQKLTDYVRGTTVNVGVVQGGTRPNVVPDEACAWIDFRVINPDEVARLETWVRSVNPVIPGAGISASLSVNRPPMPRDALMARTIERAQAIAQEIGVQLGEGSTGGASDANFVAPLGIPVLDGLGAIGEGAHSEREFIVIRSLPERSALLAALLLNW
jgi:glutamate carboxypeptidase